MTTIEKFWKEFKEKKHSVELKQSDGKLEHLIAYEEHNLVKGKSHSIRVKRINVPANHLVFMSLYLMNKNGNVTAVGETEPKPLDMDRTIEYVRFSASRDGTVKKEDFLGYILILPIEKTING